METANNKYSLMDKILSLLTTSEVAKKFWTMGLAVLVGVAVSYLMLGLSSIRALVVGICGALVLLSIKKIEVPFFITLFFIIVLQEADVTSGTVFAMLENYKFEGIPTLLETSLAVLFICFMVRYFLKRDDWSVPLLNAPMIMFFVLFLVSLYVGKSSGNDSILFNTDLRRFLAPVLFFFCAVNIINTRRKIIFLGVFTTVIVVIKAYLGMYYYMKGLGFPYGVEQVVFLESADHLMMATILIVSVSYFIFGKVDLKKIFYYLIGLAPMIFALIFSYRRHAWLGILLSLALLFYLSPFSLKIRWFGLALCGGLALVVFVSIANISGRLPSEEYLEKRFSSIADSGESSNVAHVREWEVAANATMEQPFLGLGFGSEHPPVPGYTTLKRHTVHNAFIMLWMKMGIFAVILFLWCMYRYLKLGFGLLKSRDDFAMKPLFVGLFSTFLYWMVSINVGPTWFYYRETCLMALVIAVVYQIARLAWEEDEEEMVDDAEADAA